MFSHYQCSESTIRNWRRLNFYFIYNFSASFRRKKKPNITNTKPNSKVVILCWFNMMDKNAFVSPIHKKGSKCEKSNYRPDTLLSPFSKVAEAVVHDQIAVHAEKVGLLRNSQHGFCRHRSTTSALAFLCSDWEREITSGKKHRLPLV